MVRQPLGFRQQGDPRIVVGRQPRQRRQRRRPVGRRQQMTGPQQGCAPASSVLANHSFALLGQARARFLGQPGQRQTIEIVRRGIALQKDQKIVAGRFPVAERFDSTRRSAPGFAGAPTRGFPVSPQGRAVMPQRAAKIRLAEGGIPGLLLGRAGRRNRNDSRRGKQLLMPVGHPQPQSVTGKVEDFAGPLRGWSAAVGWWRQRPGRSSCRQEGRPPSRRLPSARPARRARRPGRRATARQSSSGGEVGQRRRSRSCCLPLDRIGKRAAWIGGAKPTAWLKCRAAWLEKPGCGRLAPF